MAPKQLFTAELIKETAFSLLREKGKDYLSARNLAKALNMSVIPIYSAFKSMQVLEDELFDFVKDTMLDYFHKANAGDPVYDIGVCLVEFAESEPRLFHWLLSRQGDLNTLRDDLQQLVLERIHESKTSIAYPLNDHDLKNLLLIIWIFANGLANLVNTGNLPFLDRDMVLLQLKGIVLSVIASLKS